MSRSAKVVLVIALLAFVAQFSIAADSTNPADYFFYDDIAGGSMAASYTSVSSAAYSALVPYPGGTQSIKVDTGSTTLRNVISTTNFTADESASPYCLSYGQYDNATPVSNQEAGILFNAYANALTNRNGGTSNNATFIDNANYFPFGGAWSGINTWYNITVCYVAGYSASGTTTAVLVKNGVNYINVSTANRNSLANIGLHSRSSGPMYMGPVRIWNYTQYGIAGPQDAAAPVFTFTNTSPRNATYVFNTTVSLSFIGTHSNGPFNVTLFINGTQYGRNVTYTSGVVTNITTNATLSAGAEYLWWFNATAVNYSVISEKRNLYVAGGTGGGSATTLACLVVSNGCSITSANGCNYVQ